jgi:peptidoglycan/LPS O-acetylase OafA/YrhL
MKQTPDHLSTTATQGVSMPAAAAPPPRVPRVDGRIPSLDGLRALSIGLVLLAHLTGTQRFPVIPELGHWHLGDLGVRVFFVISGFLITTLLLEEVDRTGTVSLSKFYARRFFRIFPAFYFFCAVLFLLEWRHVITLHRGDLIAAVTYTVNYHHDRAWYAGHLWSLSVEEQFYLLWPALLLWAGVRRSLKVAMLAVLVAPSLRLAMGFWPELRPGIGETFPSVADALATGCVLAGLRPWLARSERWQRLLRSRLFWLAPLAVALAARNPSAKLDWLIGQTLMNVGIAVIIERAICSHGELLGRLLNSRPLVFIGTMSYSLYLWQQLFLFRRGTSELQSFPLNLVLAVLAALASYYLVEKPFLRLRAWFERGPNAAREPSSATASTPSVNPVR